MTTYGNANQTFNAAGELLTSSAGGVTTGVGDSRA